MIAVVATLLLGLDSCKKEQMVMNNGLTENSPEFSVQSVMDEYDDLGSLEQPPVGYEKAYPNAGEADFYLFYPDAGFPDDEELKEFAEVYLFDDSDLYDLMGVVCNKKKKTKTLPGGESYVTCPNDGTNCRKTVDTSGEHGFIFCDLY